MVAPRGEPGCPASEGLEFCGTKGSLLISRRGFTITPDPAIKPENAVPRFGSAHPVGGPVATGNNDEEQPGPQSSRIAPVMSSTSSVAMPRGSSTASARAKSRFPTLRAGIVSQRRATSPTFHSGWGASSGGMRIGRRSWVTPKLKQCSNGPIAHPGTASETLS